MYEELHKAGVELEPKGFAVGFRIEHPQRLINEIQYGKDWGGRVVSLFVRCDYRYYHIRIQLILSVVNAFVNLAAVYKEALDRYSQYRTF